VWEGIQSHDRTRIALKVLLQEHVKKKELLDQMRNEAECGKSFEHPNVVTIYEFNKDHQLPFIAMELFNALNVKQEVRDFPERLIYNFKTIALQAAEGLAHIHDKGWLHRDVKPDNFLMDSECTVKVIDFSIAQRLKKKGIMRMLGGGRSKKVQGTRSYMAPEQILGKTLDERTDIYALGCVYFELMSLRTPFSGVNPNDLLNRHLKAPIPSLSAASENASSDLADLIQRMLSKDPKGRPDSMRVVASEIKKMQVFRAGARPDPPEERVVS